MSGWLRKLFAGRKKEACGRAVQQVVKGAWPLSQRIVSFSPSSHLTLGIATEGILIVGTTGSGKSSGSGRTIAYSFLQAGFGGLVLCVKPDERRMWETYCGETGRLDDLVIFGPEEKWRFNFVNYELTRAGRGAGLVENIRKLIVNVAEIRNRNAGNSGGQDDGKYWEASGDQLLRNLLNLLMLARDGITISDLHELLLSAPKSKEMAASQEWRRGSMCFRCLAEANAKAKTPSQEKDFKVIEAYWLVHYPQLAEKTRSIIESTFTALVDVLNRGLLRDLFCEGTNLTPEAIEQGKIILIDLPVKEYMEVGQYAAAIWKYCCQQAFERRDLETSPRPLFIWQDEGQMFTLPSDMLFQCTARAFKVATVILTQNISNFYATMGGGQQSKSVVDSLFGNLNLKILHANSDSATNQWAADLIGRKSKFMMSSNQGHDGDDFFSTLAGMGSPHASHGMSEQLQYELEPSFFGSELRTGGAQNDYLVDAILYSKAVCQSTTGRPWSHVTFVQSRRS